MDNTNLSSELKQIKHDKVANDRRAFLLPAELPSDEADDRLPLEGPDWWAAVGTAWDMAPAIDFDANASVANELRQIALRFDESDRLAWRARAAKDFGTAEAAEVARDEAATAHYAASRALGELGVLLIRHAVEYRPGLLLPYLREVLRSDFESLAAAIVSRK